MPRNERPSRGYRRDSFDDFGGGAPAPSFPAAPTRPAFRAPGFGGGDAAPTGPELDASVKWFNGEKGFGFVELADGSGDVFLHASALTRSGHTTVSPGATVRVRVGQGQKGRQVSEVISVDESTATPERAGGGGGMGGPGAGGGFGDRPRFNAAGPGGPGGAPRPPRPAGAAGGFRRTPDLSTAVETTGIVKWYNGAKGFGFITPDSGGKDIFIHVSTLERSGLTGLNEGQATRLQVVQGPKGPEAASISLG